VTRSADEPPRAPHRRRTDSLHGEEPVRLTALIADDDPNFCAYIGAVARRLGFSVSCVYDGEAALEAIANTRFDLLLIDYAMPRRNGHEVITAIRADDRMGDAYAVMVTGRDDIESKLAALGAGFDDFLGKSATEAEVVAKLASARRMLSRQHALDLAVRRLYGLATRDELTGVFNRRFFAEEVQRMLDEGVAVSVVLFDLDDFKQVNDTYGHLAGDQVLRDVGAMFLRRTRSEDLIARYGGDEFVMAVTGLPVETVEALATRLADDLHAMRWGVGADSVTIGVTLGIATSTLLASKQLSRLLNAADRDLYKNKWIRRHPEQAYDYDYPAQRDDAVLMDDEGEER
jgi:diguanylate cyclase (GGDEF)-like protein